MIRCSLRGEDCDCATRGGEARSRDLLFRDFCPDHHVRGSGGAVERENVNARGRCGETTPGEDFSAGLSEIGIKFCLSNNFVEMEKQHIF
jgi:hypothetical protein